MYRQAINRGRAVQEEENLTGPPSARIARAEVTTAGPPGRRAFPEPIGGEARRGSVSGLAPALSVLIMPPAGNDRPVCRHHKAVLGGLTLHFVEAGPRTGDVVLLLHGWPQSSFAWRRVLPGLARRYRVIAPDLRGCGDSSKPAGGYDTRTVGGDIVGLLDHIDIGRAHVVGHDFGAATAYAIAAGWRDRVVTLTILDMLLPGFGLEDLVSLSETGFGLWHLAFHAAPDVPEMLIAGREREYLSWFFRNHAYDPSAITAEDLDVYVRNFRQPGALRAALGYYRALHQSAAQNWEFARTRLSVPVLALGGAFSIGAGVAGCLRRVATHVEGDIVPDSGHWVAEEQPQWLTERLLAFLAAHRPCLAHPPMSRRDDQVGEAAVRGRANRRAPGTSIRSGDALHSRPTRPGRRSAEDAVGHR